MKMNKRNGQTKLLAAIAVFAMVFCVVTVVVPDEVDATFATADNLSDLEEQVTKTYDGVITHSGTEYTLENYNGPMFVVNNTITKITLKGDNVITITDTVLTTNAGNQIAAIYATRALDIIGVAGATLSINFAGITTLVAEDNNSAYGIYTTANITITNVEVDFDILTKDNNGGARGVGIHSSGKIALNNVNGSIIGSNRAISASSTSETLSFNGCDLLLEGAERAIRSQQAVYVASYTPDGGSAINSNVIANVNPEYGNANGTTIDSGSDDEVAIKVMALDIAAGSVVDAEGVELSATGNNSPSYSMEISGILNVKEYTVGEAYQAATPNPGMIFGKDAGIKIGTGAALNVEAGFVTGSPTIVMKTEEGKEGGVFSMAEGVTAKDFEPIAKKNDGTSDTFVSPYAEGNKLVLGSTIYTLYNMEYDLDNKGNKATLTYGVGVTNPTYDGDPITIGDLMVVAKPVYWTQVAAGEETDLKGVTVSPSTSSSTFEPSTIIPIDAGSYQASIYVTIQVGEFGAADKALVDFEILPKTTTLAIKEPVKNTELWNIKDASDPRDVTIVTEYDYTGTYTETIVIVKGGVEYEQEEWDTIRVTGISETVGLKVIYEPEDSNYAPAEAVVEVKIGNRDLDSMLTLSPVSGTLDLLGLGVGMMQREIGMEVVDNLETDSPTPEDYKYNVMISGILFEVADFDGFSNNASGYFLAFQFDADVDWEKATIESNNTVTSTTGKDIYTDDQIVIVKIAEVDAAAVGSPTITIEFDADGSDSIYAKTTYTFTFDTEDDNFVLMKDFYYIVVLDDNGNIIEMAVDTTTYHYLPAGAELGFVTWVDENLNNHNAGSLMKASEAYDPDGDGYITLTADYGEVPPSGGETDDPATKADLYIRVTEDGKVGIMVYGINGLVPAGTVTVYFSYMYYDEYTEDYESAEAPFEVDVTVDEDVFTYAVGIPADIEGVFAAYAIYISDVGDITSNSGSLIFS